MPDRDRLRLRVLTAGGVDIDQEVEKVSVEALDGSFTMLPRHLDIVAPLAVGLLSYVADGAERMVAVDGGVVVKQGDVIQLATPEAVRGESADELERTLDERFRNVTEAERESRSALARLEHDVVTRMIESGEPT